MILKRLDNQPGIFFMGMITFIVAAVLGWIKLRYGFNFIDEGYHMAESWRLYAGDHFLQDELTDTLLLYTQINAQIFRVLPDITLLGFREVQYILTIISLMIFSLSLWKVEGQYWYLPFVFSIFAFTGLDPAGSISNLNYFTYPHLLLVLFVSIFLLGLHNQSIVFKRLLFIISGLCLWGTSICLLHLSVVILSPIFIFFLLRYSKAKSFSYSVYDLLYTVAPFLLCWLIFLAIFNVAYVSSVFSSTQFFIKTHWTFNTINWEAIKHIGVSSIFIVLMYVSFINLRTRYYVPFLLLASFLMYFIIATSMFGLINPYSLWFSSPMWLSSLLVAFLIIMWCLIVKGLTSEYKNSLSEEVAVIIMIPCTIQFILGSIFSTSGVLIMLDCAIPMTVSMTLILMHDRKIIARSYLLKLLILLTLLGPYYANTALGDWRFTFFDVLPKKMEVTIKEGFGKGIRTNERYSKLYDWILLTSCKYSEKNDYIISYVTSPMVYMVSKRRPALDHTFTDFDSRPEEFFENSIVKMKRLRRFPKIVYVFNRIPALIPVNPDENMYKLFGNQFELIPNNPISKYVLDNMILVDQFNVAEGFTVKCFIDKVAMLKESLIKDPYNPNINYRLGIIYQNNGDLNRAIKYYNKAIYKNPKLIPVLQNLAIIYSMKGDNESALAILDRIIIIDPDQIDAYYNIACIYSRQAKIHDSIKWLRKAVEKGFHNWQLLQADRDLENIRHTSYYVELIKKINSSIMKTTNN